MLFLPSPSTSLLVYRYVERGEIRPLVALSFPLNRIVEAQKALLERRHVGKIVLVPEHPNDVVEEGPE